MSRVLVIDDDIGTLETFGHLLRLDGFDVALASSAQQGLKHARGWRPDVILADLRLPDLSGVDFLRALRQEQNNVPVVIMTAWGTIPSAVEATKLGAVDYIEKPLFHDVIKQAVDNALIGHAHATGKLRAGIPEPHAANRWARLVVSALTSASDPKTIEDWAWLTNAARATLENRCRVAGLSAKASLDFARVLRAVVQARQMRCHPEALLDTDPRTLRRLMVTAGMVETPCIHAIDFLQRQRFITDLLALDAIKRALAEGGIS